jgi:benzil reductase ((S)-benzoin forming)
MSDLAVITGAGSGLGRALASELSRRGLELMLVGRRHEPLEQTRQALAGPGECVAADVASVDGRAAIAERVGERPVRFLVHNAAVLAPVGPLAQIELEAWRYAMAVNLEAPIFLTQALLPRLRGGRVLHISSGAAHGPLAGWGAYCISKAGLFMAYQVMREELSQERVRVGSLRPGVVDTPMQSFIREQDVTRFPSVERFRELKAGGQLRAPEEVARFVAGVLLESSEEEYEAEEWEISNPRHGERWR